MLDLDALADEPLVVKCAGEEYRLKLTAAAFGKLGAIQGMDKDGNEWDKFAAIMEQAGLPQEVFQGLDARQVTALAEAVTKKFSPKATPGADNPSGGPLPREIL